MYRRVNVFMESFSFFLANGFFIFKIKKIILPAKTAINPKLTIPLPISPAKHKVLSADEIKIRQTRI